MRLYLIGGHPCPIERSRRWMVFCRDLWVRIILNDRSQFGNLGGYKLLYEILRKKLMQVIDFGVPVLTKQSEASRIAAILSLSDSLYHNPYRSVVLD
jgi:hypothetical protein